MNQLTPLSLAIWWLDDGSIIANGRKGVISTDPFSEKENRLLKRYLSKIWRVESSLGKVSRNYNGEVKTYWRLWMRSTGELKKFLLIILPFIKVQSMLPKVILLYKDNNLQQRWISEVVIKTGFSEEIIKKYIFKKKQKWKNFRK